MYTDKIFRHIWIIKLRFLFYKLTLIGKSKEAKKMLESAWLDKLIPIGSGANLYRLRIVKNASHVLSLRPVGLRHSN